MDLTEPSDADLVAESLAGSREAFRQIVERYQTLICSLAYGATGSISRSQDMAQDTFLAAWKDLADLREPGKLRAWLCGIVRNLGYKSHRHAASDPVVNAAPLEDAHDLPALGALPCEQTITREEEAILWRSLEKIPATYREPLILFYRQHQSIEQVATALELSEENVKQRLFRGRKLLQEEVRAFVENTLRRSAPGREFAGMVLAALPLTSGSMATVGATLGAKGAATAKTGFLAVALLPLAPFIGIFAGFLVQASMASAGATGYKRCVKILKVAAFWVLVPGGCVVGESLVAALRKHYGWSDRENFSARTVFWWLYTLLMAAWITGMYRRVMAMHPGQASAGDLPAAATPPITPTRAALNIAGTYLAMYLWLIFLAWRVGDHLSAAIVLVVAVILGAWQFFDRRNRTGRSGVRATFGHVAGSCALIVLVINLRLDVWMAHGFGVSVAEIHQLYPMWLVPLLSVATMLWIGLLLALPGRPQRKTPKVVAIGGN